MRFKKCQILTFVLAIAAIPGVLLASPWIVCDPQAGVTHYQITGDPSLNGTVQAQADGSIRKDLAGIPSGQHNPVFVACNFWGCSEATPFGFNKSIPATPAGIRLGN